MRISNKSGLHYHTRIYFQNDITFTHALVITISSTPHLTSHLISSSKHKTTHHPSSKTELENEMSK